jgi:ubiquinone/menaquinone biosynthesis C-methylase UbiE
MSGSETRLDRYMKDSYTSQAESYDRVRYTSLEGSYFVDLEVRALSKWMRDPASLRLLDIPAGTGRLSIPLAEMGAEVHGVDITESMVRKAQEKAHRKGLRNVTFRVANGRLLPFQAGTFDIVTSFKFFHLIPNSEKHLFVREMARVVKPGGRLIVEFNSAYYGVVMAFLRHYLRKRGHVGQACLFPGRVNRLFEGLIVRRTMGVKLPFSGFFSKILGSRIVTAVNLAAGRVPGLKWLCYCLIVEAEKPLPRPAADHSAHQAAVL